MGMNVWGEVASYMISAMFEHHMKYDLSGYPTQWAPHKLTLFSRIIAIADVYDALGHPRVYRPTAQSYGNIIGYLLKYSGIDFDPVLVKVFINMIGVYPLGSLVLLDNHQIGVVVQTQLEEEQLYHPYVIVLNKTADGYQKGGLIDLAAVDPVTDNYSCNIVKILDPHEYGINIAEYFI